MRQEVRLKEGAKMIITVEEKECSVLTTQHIEYADGKKGKYTCTCTCGTPPNQTSDSKSCDNLDNVVCDCTGSSASVSC